MTVKPTYDELAQRVRELEKSESALKQAKKDVTSSMLFLDAVLDMSPFSMWVSDKEGTIIRTNRSLRETIRLTDDQIVGKYNVFNDENLEIPGVMSKIRAVFEARVPARLSIPWKAALAGKVDFQGARDMIIDVSMFPILDTEGQLRNVVCQWVDITEQKRAEERLKESERDFRMLANLATEAIVLHKDGELVFANDQYYRMSGYEEKELKGTNIIQKTLTPESVEMVKRRVSEGDVARYEVTALRKDGHVFPVEVRPAFLTYKGEQLRVAVVRDLTEQKQNEQKLRESELRFRSTFEQAAVGICHAAVSGAFLRLNRRFSEIVGHGREELLTLRWQDITHPDDLKTDLIHVDQLLENKITTYSMEKRFIRKNGSVIWVNLTVSLVRDALANPQYFIGVIEDLSDRRRMEAQLRQAQKMEAIGTLAGGIAHEFNNVLGIILGNAQLALDDVPEWNPASASLKEIITACFRAKEVVRQILSFARKTLISLKPLEINTIVKESLKLLRASIPAMIDIQSNIPVKPLMILGDPTEIHQIIINLCTNSAHAMENRAGVLELGISEAHLNEKSAAIYEDLGPGDFVKLTVKDSGEGISPDILEKVFEPYFTTKEFGAGNGMGLAVVYGIVKKCKGAIHIQSAVGEGTRVTMLFPKIEDKASHKETVLSGLPTGNERILLVDDDPSIVKMICQMLERLGYEVAGMTDSVEAAKRFQSDPDKFDLVITDMAMPNISGDQLAVELMKVRKDIPILLCTGHSDTVDEKRAKEMGIKGFAMKPLDKVKLSKAVRAALDQG